MNKIDSHKLMYHPHIVSKWLKGEITYPIYTEISPTSACNHRCLFCAPSFFLNYTPKFLTTSILKINLEDMAVVGVKAIMYGGEGEPLLHSDMVEIIQFTKQTGLDVALTTNGVLLDKYKISRIIPYLSWMKFSVDAATEETYAKLHRTSKKDFSRVIDNIIESVKYKRENDLDCTIGVQMLLFRENIKEVKELIEMMETIQPDYLVLKPYSEHEKQLTKELHQPYMYQINKLRETIKNSSINIIFREDTLSKVGEKKPYKECYAQDFMAYIDSLGGVHSCINFIGDDGYEYGNIYEHTFGNIWKDKHTITPNLKKCRTVCRMDKVNRYLWELKHPIKDVNFI